MSDFVQQCRREWERLRVPDPVANEMAADLAADLEEAAAEGVSAEEVLGRSAFDPRSFAASWAAERGVIPSAIPLAPQESASRKPLIVSVLAFLTVIGLIGAAFIALPVRSRSVAIAPQPRVSLAPPAPSGLSVLNSGPVAAELVAWILLLLLVAIVGVVVAAWLWSRWIRSRPPTAQA